MRFDWLCLWTLCLYWNCSTEIVNGWSWMIINEWILEHRWCLVLLSDHASLFLSSEPHITISWASQAPMRSQEEMWPIVNITNWRKGSQWFQVTLFLTPNTYSLALHFYSMIFRGALYINFCAYNVPSIKLQSWPHLGGLVKAWLSS